MSDSLFTEITDEATNPLLGIDTSFRSYLNAYTRSFSNHVVGGALDYAFDSDFAVRQKIQSLSAWGRLSKSIDSQDITQEAKFLFSKCNQAGMLKYPEIYDIVRKCADRLELRLPIVFVREDTDAKQIYSIASSIIEPCIVITSALASDCTEEELTILIGMECGKIQNNHCIYSFAGSYISNSPAKFKPVERSYNHTIGNQLICALSEWIELGDITIDRAAMICCDEPEKYGEILSGLLNRNFTDMYGRKIPKHAHGTVNLDGYTSSSGQILQGVTELFDRIGDKNLLVRRINMSAEHVIPESQAQEKTEFHQLDLFTDYAAVQKEQEKEAARLERERKMQKAVLEIKKKFGKNAVLRGMNLEEGATARDRNGQIGGHKA